MLTRILPDQSGCSCEQTTDEPTPSLRTHYKRFTTTTSRSASARRIGTQRLTVSAARRAPSRHPGPFQDFGSQCRRSLSHVPHRSRRPGSRRLHAGHRLASKRAPARLIPEKCTHPGADVVCCFSTLPQRFALARLPDPCLAAHTPPFPHRSPQRSSANAARGGLTPPPRRAMPKGHKSFISYVAPLQEDLPTPVTSLRARGTRA